MYYYIFYTLYTFIYCIHKYKYVYNDIYVI